MKKSSRVILILIAIALFPAVVLLQKQIDPLRPQFQPGKDITGIGRENPVEIPFQFMAGAMIGMREVVAGLLWVKAGEFWHEGNSDAMVPLMRIATWLDPHYIDIYNTGAWHLAYNLTDSDQRADHRLLPAAIKFIDEGITVNPNVSDLKIGRAFSLHLLKEMDPDKAVYWMKESSKDPDAPLYVSRQIAICLEKAGRIDESLAQWKKCLEKGKEIRYSKTKTNMEKRGNEVHYVTSKLNYEGMVIRQELRKNLSKNPLDAEFTAKFTRIGPRKFVISGTTALPDKAGIWVTLQDADFEEPELEKFTWDIDQDATCLYETGINSASVRRGQFSRKYDLSKDFKQYPFKKENYNLIIIFDPRFAEPSIQDRVGWVGEGLTDKNYLDTSVPGLRRIKMVIPLTKRDLI